MFRVFYIFCNNHNLYFTILKMWPSLMCRDISSIVFACPGEFSLALEVLVLWSMEYGVWTILFSIKDNLFCGKSSCLKEFCTNESHCSNNNLWTVYVEVADFSHLSYLNIPVGMPGLQWLTLWPCCSLHTGGYPGWDEGSEHEHPAPAGGHLPRGRGRPFTVAPTTTWSYPLHSPLPRVRKLVFLLVQMIVLPCSFWSAYQ